MTSATRLDTLSLVPPARLGRLLAEARARRGRSREVIAAATGERFDAEELAEVEAGRRPLLDTHISVLVEAYGLRPSNPRSRRTELVVDRGEVLAGSAGGGRAGNREGWTVDVLCRYLGLVYVLRRRTPGEDLALRQADLDVLADVLGARHAVVEERLVRLMANPGDKVGRRARRFERRVMVADAGILVAATAGGALVLEPRAADPGPGVPARPAERQRLAGNVVPFARPAGRPADVGRAAPLVAIRG
jgi:hypothetical protein